MGDHIQFFAAVHQAGEAGEAPWWLQGPVPCQDTNKGLELGFLLQEPAQCHLSWVLEVTQILSKLLVLGPPVCSKLGAAELLDSLKEENYPGLEELL